MELKVINKKGQLLLHSRDVAEMTGKRHFHLTRDIEGYIRILSTNPNLDSLNFFIPSNYKWKRGKPPMLPAYSKRLRHGCKQNDWRKGCSVYSCICNKVRRNGKQT